MNKKVLISAIFIFLAIAAAMVLLKGFSNEDDWICSNGEWTKHGNPSAPQPAESCGTKQAINPDIIVSSPKRNQAIKSPLTIEGMATGHWFFEAVFPIKIFDDQGNQLAASYVQATNDWMTEKLVPFKGEIAFQPGTAVNGTLVLKNDNPSGLPENEIKIEVPVVFSRMVKVYFNNNKMDPEVSCNKVFAVERSIPKTSAVGRAALEELLKGLTEQEKTDGYFTSIKPGAEIQKLTIENGVAKVDFNEQLEFQVGGSCWVSAIRAQITQTLKQFPTVNEVVISINGRTEDILQP
ncbi:MAG: GerMN domain-containing protein [Candidatus Paceibacterota bacterium]